MKKLLGLPIGLLVFIVLCCVAMAVSGWVIRINYEIVPSDTITIYTSPNMTAYKVVDNVGQLERGQMKQADVFIVNNSDKTIGIDQDMFENEEIICLLMGNPADTENVTLVVGPGASINATLMVIAKTDAGFGVGQLPIDILPWEIQ